MSERLTDEQVAYIARSEGAFPAHEVDLAREVQMWRALVNGESCETCNGFGYKRIIGLDAEPGDVLRCPDCIDGRKPGIVERLARVCAHYEPWGSEDNEDTVRTLTAIVNALRAAVGS